MQPQTFSTAVLPATEMVSSDDRFAAATSSSFSSGHGRFQSRRTARHDYGSRCNRATEMKAGGGGDIDDDFGYCYGRSEGGRDKRMEAEAKAESEVEVEDSWWKNLGRVRDGVSNLQHDVARSPMNRSHRPATNGAAPTSSGHNSFGNSHSAGINSSSRLMGEVGKGIVSFLSLHDELARTDLNGSSSSLHLEDLSDAVVLPGRRGSSTTGKSYEAVWQEARQAATASKEAQRRAKRAQKGAGGGGGGGTQLAAAALTVKSFKASRRVPSLPIFGGGSMGTMGGGYHSSNVAEKVQRNSNADTRSASQRRTTTSAKTITTTNNNSTTAMTTREGADVSPSSVRRTRLLGMAAGEEPSFASASSSCGDSGDVTKTLSPASARSTAPLVARHGCVAHIQICRHRNSSLRLHLHRHLRPPLRGPGPVLSSSTFSCVTPRCLSSSRQNDDDGGGDHDDSRGNELRLSDEEHKSNGNNVSDEGGRHDVDNDDDDDDDDDRRLRLATELPLALRSILCKAYDCRIPDRADASRYVVMEGGGVGMTLCVFEPAPGHPDVEYTAFWIGSNLLAWARAWEHDRRGGKGGEGDETKDMDPAKMGGGGHIPTGRGGKGTERTGYDLRCGLSAGVLETVRDTYGCPGVIGRCADAAAKMAESALPGQMLASSDTVIPALSEKREANLSKTEGDEPRGDATATACGEKAGELGLVYRIDWVRHEVVVRNERTALLAQSVIGFVSPFSSFSSSWTCSTDGSVGGGHKGQATASAIVSSSSNLFPFGTDAHPEKKWDHRLRPTKLRYDHRLGYKAKSPPAVELLRRHRRVAFVGVTHCQLAGVFRQVLEANPSHIWNRIYLLFLTDDRLCWVANDNGGKTETETMKTTKKKHQIKTEQELRSDKRRAQSELKVLLQGRVADLRFLEYDRPFYCASYWDWDERGGFIHVSPLVWGSDLRICPAINYHWIDVDAGDDYVAYQDGLTSLLQTSKAT